MRFERGDVRGPYRFIQNRSRTFLVALKCNAMAEKSKINFGEIFRVARFSTFATISARNGSRGCHSITSSARAISVGGMWMPKDPAVAELITKLNSVGC